jgi:hypothetical protein
LLNGILAAAQRLAQSAGAKGGQPIMAEGVAGNLMARCMYATYLLRVVVRTLAG